MGFLLEEPSKLGRLSSDGDLEGSEFRANFKHQLPEQPLLLA
jgi:hypothetical protein